MTQRIAGRSLDAKMAEALGWRAVAEMDLGVLIGKTPFGPFGVGGTLQTVPAYSTDVAAAMQVVAEVQRRFPGWRFMLLGGDASFGWTGRGDDVKVIRTRRIPFGWRASFFGHEDPTQNTGQRHADERGETPALAICLAALKAIESASPAKASVDSLSPSSVRDTGDQ